MAVDRLTMWLRYLAKWLIDNKHPYNAAKHGFTAMADQAYLNVIDDESGTAFLTHSGPSLEYLSHGGWRTANGRGRSRRDGSTRSSCGSRSGLPATFSKGSSVGRARFLGGAEINVYQPTYTPAELRTACGHRSIETFSIPLLKEHKLKPPPPAK